MISLWAWCGAFNSFAAVVVVGKRYSKQQLFFFGMVILVMWWMAFFALPQAWLLVLWVPVVEEMVFRLGLSSYLQRYLGSRFWGRYGAVLVFALLHMVVLLLASRELRGEVMVGPFILGWVCEGLYARSGSLLPGMVVHGVCNLIAGAYLPLTPLSPRMLH